MYKFTHTSNTITHGTQLLCRTQSSNTVAVNIDAHELYTHGIEVIVYT